MRSKKMRKFTKKYFLYVFGVLIIITWSYIITSLIVLNGKPSWSDGGIPVVDRLYSMHRRMFADDTSCYFEKDEQNDVLFSIKPGMYNRSAIFFHKTSCGGTLDVLEACSVEAAARSHPHRHVNVLFLSPIPNKWWHQKILSYILELPNVDIYRINLNKYARALHAVKGLFQPKVLNRGLRRYRRVAEILKFVTLYLYGGVVLDLDVIVAKSLDGLGNNWAVKQNNSTLGSAAVAVGVDRAGKELSRDVLKALNSHRYLDDIHAGKSLSQVLKSIQYSMYRNNNMTTETCQGFSVFGEEYFYPINQSSWHQYFRPGHLRSSAYGYHLWNSEHYKKTIPMDSLYADLARKYCPSVFSRGLREYQEMDATSNGWF